MIYACSSKFILKIKKSYWEGNVKFIEIPKIRSIDIDDMSDFRLAELIYKNKNFKFMQQSDFKNKVYLITEQMVGLDMLYLKN